MPPASVVHEIFRTLGRYLKGQVKVAIVLGLLYSLGYAIAGVPWWMLIGILSGALNLLPVIGGVVALLLAALVTLFADGSLYTYIGLLTVFVVLQALESFYLTPKLVGSQVGLKPWSVFLAILIGGFLFGPVGLLIAVPCLAVLAILWRRHSRVPEIR